MPPVREGSVTGDGPEGRDSRAGENRQRGMRSVSHIFGGLSKESGEKSLETDQGKEKEAATLRAGGKHAILTATREEDELWNPSSFYGRTASAF